MTTELKIAIAFARLELLEVEAGKRSLLHCPGVEEVAKAIAEEIRRQKAAIDSVLDHVKAIQERRK